MEGVVGELQKKRKKKKTKKAAATEAAPAMKNRKWQAEWQA